eukprot:272622-Chlamydomonas_euryale.AAC.7
MMSSAAVDARAHTCAAGSATRSAGARVARPSLGCAGAVGRRASARQAWPGSHVCGSSSGSSGSSSGGLSGNSGNSADSNRPLPTSAPWRSVRVAGGQSTAESSSVLARLAPCARQGQVTDLGRRGVMLMGLSLAVLPSLPGGNASASAATDAVTPTAATMRADIPQLTKQPEAEQQPE